tara:strand:- start:48 stop:536 length:489 start_codon:yes stop_codon:yes gene_type:complete
VKVGDLNSLEMRKLFEFAQQDERFGVAFRGALSQIRHKLYLESLGFSIEETQSDNAGEPDFILNGDLTMEHKRARSETYPDGSLKVELQKSRGKVPERLYDTAFSDIVAVDVSHHTGTTNDYRYAHTSSLRRHNTHPNKIATMQKIDDRWVSDLDILLGDNQ